MSCNKDNEHNIFNIMQSHYINCVQKRGNPQVITLRSLKFDKAKLFGHAGSVIVHSKYAMQIEIKMKTLGYMETHVGGKSQTKN